MPKSVVPQVLQGKVVAPGTTRVGIFEFERGWGSKCDEVREFPSYADAEAFCKDYNKDNNKTPVPDWYMAARIL